MMMMIIIIILIIIIDSKASVFAVKGPSNRTT